MSLRFLCQCVPCQIGHKMTNHALPPPPNPHLKAYVFYALRTIFPCYFFIFPTVFFLHSLFDAFEPTGRGHLISLPRMIVSNINSFNFWHVMSLSLLLSLLQLTSTSTLTALHQICLPYYSAWPGWKFCIIYDERAREMWESSSLFFYYYFFIFHLPSFGVVPYRGW